MDPPLVNEASFANPSSYSLAGLLSFPINGGGGSAEVSTVTEQSGGGGKRKREVLGNYSLAAAASSSKIDAVSNHDSVNEWNVKRLNESETKDENISLKTEGDTNSRTSSKPFVEEKAKPEPPKDYIHVRARRGQATDSHSLAERARREKISERMKMLQDLVPGCNKVIGKALVLDEIINYIQSLQRQVEFLSMKLEAVNSGMNPTIEGFPNKDLTTAQAFNANNAMLYAPQTAREYTQRAQTEWLHMQIGSTHQGAA